jgi:hypothetical protein
MTKKEEDILWDVFLYLRWSKRIQRLAEKKKGIKMVRWTKYRLPEIIDHGWIEKFIEYLDKDGNK